MAERKGMGRSLGAVGGSGRGGDQGRSEGGREWGYGEEGVGRGRETEGLMSPPIMRMRGLSREGRGGPLPIGRGGMRGREGGATGAGRAQVAGRIMRDPMMMAASLVGKYLTADAQLAAQEAGEEDTNRATALLKRMTQAAAEENQARGDKGRLDKVAHRGGRG